MMRQRQHSYWIAALALLTAIPLGFAQVEPAMAQQTGNIAQTVPNLNVQGRAELSKPADELRLNIGVVTQHEEASEAVRQNARQMREVLAGLEGAGLEEDDYETGRYQIHPVYTQRPVRQPARPGQEIEDWHPRIAAYRVTNVVHVKTKQIDKAGEIIDAASRAGANTIDSIRFTLSDPRTHRTEAIATATQNAVNDARALARAAGLRLVRIVSISLDEPPPIAPIRHEMARLAMDAPEEPTPIRPGDVTVRATVNIVYEIAPQD